MTWWDPEGEFERTRNPFGLLVAAQQAALRTRLEPERRAQERFRLVRYLYGHGLERKDMEDLFRLIQCLTALPSGLELKFREELTTFEESKVMTTETLIAPLERMAMERGRAEGWQKGQQEGWQKGQQEGWQKGQQEGWHKGQQEGRQEGRREGLHQGTVVGRVQYTQELLGLPVTDAAELASKDPAALQALASELDARLRDQLARLRSRPPEN